LGKHVLKALIANSELSVTVLAREDSNSTYPPHIPVIRTDFSASSLEAALKGQDAVVSTVTHLALKEQEKVLHAAVKSGVQRFIPSEFGSDTSNDALLRAVPYSAIKRRVIDQLMQLEGMGPKAYFSWTTVIPGPFFEWSVSATK
jgi:putative NADH-flavin reductase